MARGESLVWSLGKGPGSIVLRDARTLIDLPVEKLINRRLVLLIVGLTRDLSLAR